MKVKTSAAPASMAGLSGLEVLIVSVIVLGALIISFQASQSINTSFNTAERRVGMVTTATILLDQLDSQLRSSSLDISPIRVFDPNSPLLKDHLDNDGDQRIDEIDEGFYGASLLQEGTEVGGVWFTRVLSIDDRFVPPRVRYAPPSFVNHELEAGEVKDGIDNDGDGIIDEGVVTLLAGQGKTIIARGVTEFRILRTGRSIDVRMTIERAQEGKKPPISKTLHRSIYPRNG